MKYGSISTKRKKNDEWFEHKWKEIIMHENVVKRKMIESQLNKRIETIYEWMGEWMSGIIE